MEEKAVFCSPSKVRDFDRYFLSYPQVPLKTDLFADLILYPKLLISNVAFATLFSLSRIERGPWKKAFEDLINFGAFEVITDYPSKEEELRLMNAADDAESTDESVLDLSLLTLYSQKREMPLIFRQREANFLARADSFIEAIADKPEQSERKIANNLHMKSRVAIWILEMKIPRLFIDKIGQQQTQLLPEEKPEEFVFIAPDELISFFKHQDALSQLRDHICQLSSLYPSRAYVQDYLEQQRRLREKKIKYTGIVFNVLDFGLALITGPYLSIILKSVEKFSNWRLSNPYRWLLFTEKINAKIEA